MKSFAYRILPSWDRSSFSLNGNTYQTYIWTETNNDVQQKVGQKLNTIYNSFRQELNKPKGVPISENL